MDVCDAAAVAGVGGDVLIFSFRLCRASPKGRTGGGERDDDKERDDHNDNSNGNGQEAEERLPCWTRSWCCPLPLSYSKSTNPFCLVPPRQLGVPKINGAGGLDPRNWSVFSCVASFDSFDSNKPAKQSFLKPQILFHFLSKVIVLVLSLSNAIFRSCLSCRAQPDSLLLLPGARGDRVFLSTDPQSLEIYTTVVFFWCVLPVTTTRRAEQQNNGLSRLCLRALIDSLTGSSRLVRGGVCRYYWRVTTAKRLKALNA